MLNIVFSIGQNTQHLFPFLSKIHYIQKYSIFIFPKKAVDLGTFHEK